MSFLFNHPKLTNDFRRELNFVLDAEPEVRAKARQPFMWINEMGAAPLLFKALSECAPLCAVSGLDKKPSFWLAPPPSGLGHHIGIVIGLDNKGTPRCCATNTLPLPVITDGDKPLKDFFVAFDALRSQADQTTHIHRAISQAAAGGHMDWVNQVASEGQRYRTMPAYLVALIREVPSFYATTILIEGPRQMDPTRAFTGKVRP